jgi:hypothetical protein
MSVGVQLPEAAAVLLPLHWCARCAGRSAAGVLCASLLQQMSAQARPSAGHGPVEHSTHTAVADTQGGLWVPSASSLGSVPLCNQLKESLQQLAALSVQSHVRRAITPPQPTHDKYLHETSFLPHLHSKPVVHKASTLLLSLKQYTHMCYTSQQITYCSNTILTTHLILHILPPGRHHLMLAQPPQRRSSSSQPLDTLHSR